MTCSTTICDEEKQPLMFEKCNEQPCPPQTNNTWQISPWTHVRLLSHAFLFSELHLHETDIFLSVYGNMRQRCSAAACLVRGCDVDQEEDRCRLRRGEAHRGEAMRTAGLCPNGLAVVPLERGTSSWSSSAPSSSSPHSTIVALCLCLSFSCSSLAVSEAAQKPRISVSCLVSYVSI